ncbi:MAG: methyl-accepting chemotaxis protein [Armatimonadetes bacterium]|nr:methyl-accepting chemotaxis protein [Armatimonadota bacterium]
MFDRVPLSTKMVVMLLLPVIPLLFFATSNLVEARHTVSALTEFSDVVALARVSADLGYQLEKERTLACLVRGPQGGRYLTDFQAQQKETDATLGQFDAFLKGFRVDDHSASIGELMATIRQGLAQLSATRGAVATGTVTMGESNDIYTGVIEELLRVGETAAPEKTDQDILAALMAYSYFLHSEDHKALERGILANIFAANRHYDDLLSRYSEAVWMAEAFEEAFLVLASKEHREFFTATLGQEGGAGWFGGEVGRMEQLAYARAAKFGVDPAAWLRESASQSEALKRVADRLGADLATLTEDTRAAAATTFWLTLGFTTLVVLGSVLFGVFLGRQTAGHLKRAAEDTLSTAGQIESAARQQSATTSETAASVRQTTTTLEEIRQTSVMTNQKAGAVSEVAARSQNVSHEARQAVARGIQGMQQIHHQVEQIAQTILELSEKNIEIGDIVQAVNGIAEQSNLLAVNASIEAAKAEEHGKGFAVVAGEVKALATQSREATERIRVLLSEIQKSSNAAVMVTEQGAKRVEEGSRLMEELGATIDELNRVIEENADAAGQIAAASGEQFTGVEQITGAIRDVEQAANDSAAGAEQLSQASQQMARISQDLLRLVGGRSNGR